MFRLRRWRLDRPSLVVPMTLVVVLAVAAGLGMGPLGDPLAAEPEASRSPFGGASASPSATEGASASPSAVPPTATPTLAPTVAPPPPVALVPVTSFRTPLSGTSRAELRDVLAGASDRYVALELPVAEVTSILEAADLDWPADPDRLILAPDAAALRADLAAHPDRIGILRAGEVDASVRALAWEGDALFGVARVASLAAWSLTAPLPARLDADGYDPAGAWTLFAGGDVLLDRGVYLTTRVNGKGADYPFDGGRVSITSRYCCSSFGWQLPNTRRDGGAGDMRALISGADLALANFENPAPDRFTWHQSGTVFHADPSLIEGLKNAGIDWVSLANNHIGDARASGILQTMAALDGWGIAHGGAGKGAEQVHAATILEAGGINVGILGYDTIASYYWQTTPTGVGSARMTEAALREDIAAARAAGADLVIVFPHWGVEYTTRVSSQQSRLGHAAIDAGADLVIGNHPHWAGALEIYKGRPIWYALGNFVFDQTWSEPTMEGITLELTFQGTRLLQAVMHPHLILDKSQPNLMDPAGSGAVVMEQVFAGSKGLLPW